MAYWYSMSRLSSRSSRPSNLQHSPLHAVCIIVTTPHTDHYPGPTQAKQESLPRPLPRAYPGQTRITTQTTTPGLPRPNKNHYTDHYPGPTQAKQESLPRPLPRPTQAKQESLPRPLLRAYTQAKQESLPRPLLRPKRITTQTTTPGLPQHIQQSFTSSDCRFPRLPRTSCVSPHALPEHSFPALH